MSAYYKWGNKCAAAGCKAKPEVVQFFRFPHQRTDASKLRHRKWVECADNPCISATHAYLCELHFERNQFRDDSRTQLIYRAVPTIQSNDCANAEIFSEHQQQEQYSQTSEDAFVTTPQEHAEQLCEDSSVPECEGGNEMVGVSKRNLLLISSSEVHGYGYLTHAAVELKALLLSVPTKRVLFVPYALADHDKYAEKVRVALDKLCGFEVESIHKANDPVAAVKEAQAIFIGGGNTFRLLKTLYDKQLIEPIRSRALEDGVPYIGSSAGTNVATVNICTTNDMPIVYPPSFDALNLVPFNINPHYVDPEVNSTHKGETREERLRQYHEIPGVPPVLGLREGAMLRVEGNTAQIRGVASARLFQINKPAEEYARGSDVSFLLK